MAEIPKPTQVEQVVTPPSLPLNDEKNSANPLATCDLTILWMLYFLKHMSPLIVWNADDVTPESKLEVLDVPKLNQHFHIFDRGSSLVLAPKDLFSHIRTLNDTLSAVKSLVDMIRKKGWSKIEMAGFEILTRMFWVHNEVANALSSGLRVEITHYEPSDLENQLVPKAIAAAKRFQMTTKQGGE